MSLDVEPVVAALSRCRQSLRFLTCLRTGSNVDFLESLAARYPTLERLDVQGHSRIGDDHNLHVQSDITEVSSPGI